MAEPGACPHQQSCSTLPPQLYFHAVASFSGLAALRALSVNHQRTGLTDLNHFSLPGDAVVELHEALRRRGIESFVLRTCNRSELYWRARVPGDDEVAVAAFSERLGLATSELSRVAVGLEGEAAARHLFRVCSGLESLIVGEAEILGQVRDAMSASASAGPFLEGVVRAALRTGRLARAETGIGTGALSVASAGVQWLADRLPADRRRVLVIGAGSTGAKVARRLRSIGATHVVIANRTVAHAERLASTVGGAATGLDSLAVELARADAVICAATTSEWLVSADDLRNAVANGRSLAVVDLSMPAGIEPADVAGVTRMDLAGLKEMAEQHRQKRAAQIPAVEAVIARELEWLQSWVRHQAMRPFVSDLRRKVEAIRRAELSRAEAEIESRDASDTTALDRLSRRLIDRILEIPLAQLETGDVPLDAAHAEYLRRLFALPETPVETPVPEAL